MMTINPNLEDLMASRPTPLTLRAHHDARSWSTDWYDDTGHRRMKRFGKEGDVSLKEATARYQNWISEWNGGEHVRNPTGETATYTVGRLCDDYWTFAEKYYVKHGKPTSFISEVKSALDRLRDAYASERVSDINAPMIARLRDSMIQSAPINDEGDTRALMRKTVNGRLTIIKQAFTWAHAEKGRVSVQVAWSISSVRTLAEDRTDAKESDPVPAIADSEVAKMLRSGTRILGDMVRIQRLTGMRPEEVCIMRGIDIEANGETWLYTPRRHKTEHHNKKRIVAIGFRARRIIKRRLKTDLMAYLFTPAEAIAEAATTMGQRLGTRHGNVYCTRSYRQAIHRACIRAEIEPFNPNQLRHAWAKEVRQAFNLEAVAAGLGHSDLKTAEIYAERDIEKAKEVARKVG